MTTLTKYLNVKKNPDKVYFFEYLKKTSRYFKVKKKFEKVVRKRVIKKLFTKVEKISRLLKLMYLIKMSIVSKEITEKRWIRVLIRKWRFISFSKNISKKKMAFLYKHLHVNYLEMVNDVFGEEERANPSVIKEFERFGANVGMWENEHPDFVEESNFCKNVQKRFSFHAPSISKIKLQEIKKIKEKELIEQKEVKEIQKMSKKDKKEEKEEDVKEGEKDIKGKGTFHKKYFRKNI